MGTTFPRGRSRQAHEGVEVGFELRLLAGLRDAAMPQGSAGAACRSSKPSQGSLASHFEQKASKIQYWCEACFPLGTRDSGLHLLSARRVQTSRKGVHCDGGGLRRRVKAASASWVLRYTAPSAKRRELGLGAADQTSTAAAGKSLRDARDAADNARKLIRSGVDPIDEKRAKREKAREAEVATKAETERRWPAFARAYHERVIEPKRTEVHAREWISSLERHVPREIWHKPIDRIEAPELLDAVVKVTSQYPETGRRVRQRLELVFADAEFRKLCNGNPGRAIREKVREECGGRKTESYRTLHYRDVPLL